MKADNSRESIPNTPQIYNTQLGKGNNVKENILCTASATSFG